MTKKFIILFVAAAVLFIGGDLSIAADATVVPGKIVVNHDEWTFKDDGGFNYLPDDTSAFAQNVASWFTGGNPGDFLVYSADLGLTGSALASTMLTAGHTWTISTEVPDEDLIEYDAIFVAGPYKPDNAVLIDYVESGGNVYLAGGTGGFGWPPDGSDNEATAWNDFLNHFNLNFLHSEGGLYNYNGVCCVLPVNSPHPIFTGVNFLYYNNGNSVSELDATDLNTDILEFDNSHGLIGVFDGGGVAIDIKPGSDPNSINLSSAGVIPVAILSSATFDATTVDPETVSLAGAEIKMVGKSGKYLSHEEDVNDDGLPDLVCQVLTEDWAIEPGATSVVLTAQTYEGQDIHGEDTIRIVPDK